VAAIAAALADFIIEGLANRGVFGHARFTDESNAVNGPVAVLGAVFLLRFLYLRVRQSLRAADGEHVPSARACRRLTPAGIAWRLGAMYAVQIAALWTMETLEQYLVFGHGFGGTIWLGGPTAVSLAVHALLCVATAFGARALLRALEPRALRLIRALLAVLGSVGGDSRPHFCPGLAPVIVRPYFVLCRIGVRAPPAAVS
jgi:arginine exporter protein ArgO